MTKKTEAKCECGHSKKRHVEIAGCLGGTICQCYAYRPATGKKRKKGR